MLWKIFLLIYLLMTLSNWHNHFTYSFGWWHLFFIASDCIWFIGFFGYVFKKPIWSQWIWQILFPSTLVLTGLVTSLIPNEELERFSYVQDAGMVAVIFIIALTVIFLGPCFLALSLYSFRAKEIWSAERVV